jgi:small GTP-binding protein
VIVQKKICMIGTFSVGKTSLVRQFVHRAFSEKYETNIGVKMEKKPVKVNDSDVMMVLWDIYGEDRFQKMQMTYLRGMHGYLLVADSTRRQTYDEALALHEKVTKELGKIPFLFLLNKSDLTDQREIESDAETALEQRGWQVLRTSAKTGEGVEEAFMRLAADMTSK